MPDLSGRGTDDIYIIRPTTVLCLGDARQETSLSVGLLEKIVAGKKEIRLSTFYQKEIDSTCSFLSVAEEAYYPPPLLSVG